MAKPDQDIKHLLPSDAEKLSRLADGIIDVHQDAIKKLRCFKDEITAEFPESFVRRSFKPVTLHPSGQEEKI